jgi:23S rRNA pseudouridine2605 synthase
VKSRKPNKAPSKPESPRQKPSADKTPRSVAERKNIDATQDVGERVQKVLARGGIGSRREIEVWISEGRLKLNGSVVKLGDRLNVGDHLLLNDRLVNWQKFAIQPTRVLLYHKPAGEVVTRRDPQGRPIVFTQLPKLATARWIAVGRLDINTSGLLLVTNNGELANRLMHPSSQIEREYAVRVLGEVSDATIEKLKKGVELEDGIAKFDDIKFYAGEGANKWYYVTVSEGRNRLVRRLWESQAVVVSRLIRVRYGPIVLPERLKNHSFYEITDKELDLLFEFAKLDKTDAEVVDKAQSIKPSKPHKIRPRIHKP